jgi:hypothetical protein
MVRDKLCLVADGSSHRHSYVPPQTMSLTPDSLTKLVLPPELATSIGSFGCLTISPPSEHVLIHITVAVYQTTSAATLVGECDTSTSKDFGGKVRVIFPGSMIPLKTLV